MKYVILFFGVLAVSFGAILARLAEAPFLIIAFYRLAVATAILGPITVITSKGRINSSSKKNVILSLAAGLFLALHFGFWIASLEHTTVASSVVLVTTNPLFVALASYFLFKEKLTKNTLTGILICLIGAILIGYGDFTLSKEAFMGDVLAILGAITVAGYFIIGRILRPNVNLINYTFMVYGSAAVFLLLASMIADVKLIGYSSSTYMIFVLMGIVPQLLGHSSLNWALRFMPATLVTIAILGEPVGATLLAKWILDENPTVLQIVGGIVILTGIFIAFRRANNTTNV